MGPVRQQIAFYASTPDYAAVLELHGWDFAEKLRAMSRRGEWAEMAAVIPDEMMAEVAVVAPLDELGAAIRARYGDRLQRVGYYAVDGAASWAPGDWSQLISDTRGLNYGHRIERKASVGRRPVQMAEIVESEQPDLGAGVAVDLDRGDRSIAQGPQPAHENIATGREARGP